MGWLDLLTRTPNPSCRWAWSIPIRRRAVVEHRSRVFQCLPTVEYVQHFRSVDNSTGLSFYLSFFDSVSWKTAFAPRSLDPKVWWSLLQVAVVVECCGHMMNDEWMMTHVAFFLWNSVDLHGVSCYHLGAQEAHAILARGGLSEELAAETLAACGDNSIHVHVAGHAVAMVVLRSSLEMSVSGKARLSQHVRNR